MKSPVIFGIYSIPNSKFLLNLNQYYKTNLSPELFKESRPFICVYINTKYGERPYFVPLTSINPNKKNYGKRKRKWEGFQNLEEKSKTKTLLIMDNPTNNTPGYKSVAVLYQAFPLPLYGLKFKPFIKHKKIMTIPEDTAAILKDLTQSYLDATQTSKKHPFVPLRGHLKFVRYAQKNKEYLHYPVNHCLLLDIIKAKEVRRSKAKEKATQNSMEEKEK